MQMFRNVARWDGSAQFLSYVVAQVDFIIGSAEN